MEDEKEEEKAVDLDENLLHAQDEDIDPDAIAEERDEEDKDHDQEEEDQAQIQQILKDEDITLVPESQDISEIDKLTGVPHRNDGLLFGIPMLAPYPTI